MSNDLYPDEYLKSVINDMLVNKPVKPLYVGEEEFITGVKFGGVSIVDKNVADFAYIHLIKHEYADLVAKMHPTLSKEEQVKAGELFEKFSLDYMHLNTATQLVFNGIIMTMIVDDDGTPRQQPFVGFHFFTFKGSAPLTEEEILKNVKIVKGARVLLDKCAAQYKEMFCHPEYTVLC